MSIFHWKYVQMCVGISCIIIRILHGPVYGCYMNFYVGLIWVVYMWMCLQLINSLNILLEICPNVLGGVKGGGAWSRIRIRHTSLYGFVLWKPICILYEPSICKCVYS